jgi:hypothetical protein
MTQIAPWIAALAAICSLMAIVWAGRSLWRAWDQLGTTSEAAGMLLDAHHESLDAAISRMSDASEHLGPRHDELMSHVNDLRVNTEHMRWLLDQVPARREELSQALLDAVLPTRDDDQHEHATSR